MRRWQAAQGVELWIVLGMALSLGWSMWTGVVRLFWSVDRGGPNRWSRTPL
jgi:hypothetical protein